MASVEATFLAPWVGDQKPPPSPLASNPVVFRRRYSTGLHILDRKKEDKRASMIEPSVMTPKLMKSTYIEDDDDLDDDDLDKQDNTMSLAEFFKSNDPPSDNFMSVPYSYGEEKERESKWHKFMSIKRRSKSVPRPPVNIQLPDSAVSGVTSGGHRHIAISIPLDAMPFATDSKAQDDTNVKNNTGVKSGGAKTTYGTLPRNFAVQTYSEENGTITVYHPITTETPEGLAKALASQRNSILSQQSVISASSLGERSNHTQSSHRRSNSQSTGYSTEASTVASTKSKQPHYFSIFPKPTTLPQGLHPTPPRRPNSQQRSAQRSAKATSMVVAASQKHHHPAHSASIDGLLSLIKDEENVRDGYNKKPLPSPPPKSEARNKQQYKPGIGFPSPITEETDGSSVGSKRAVRKAVSTQSMLSVSKETPSRPSTAGSIQSRRDKVRDKKRRDMEAVRNAKMLKELQQRRQSEYKQKGEEVESADADEQSKSKGKGPQKASPIYTLCPIVVVADLQPSPGLPQETPVSTPRVSSPRVSSPSQMRLSRDIDSELYLEQKRNMMDKQILRLYESYHENRLRDVERRIRRLERNGDVWLRALVPVLDDMSRNIKSINPSLNTNKFTDAEGRGWASDDEVTAERKARSTKRNKATTRRASLSRERIAAGLVGEKLMSDDSEWSDTMSRSDDVSGLGIIEPLMRELAGEARRRQQQIAERTADDWRGNTV
ncbi:hypothetical protein TGAM01_v209620 [Trichoderma gamsii]|uniref:Uncharacterized protein n=1 Tax=Trichoderma gamsii TaxID=398673 RepID=A0A2P4ZB11_9HYPO|nr:hypothetical protein TGAM01_v209620 [Trichoderma gamsii]PON21457.1 hypothetical protein TGAM01_v209620 [Trichoderma gamsii]